MAIPTTRAKVTAVWTVFEALSSSLAPMCFPNKTLAPTDTPTNKLINKLISELVEPTAAKASLPVNLPTTITSAALNNSCNTPDNIKGIANNMIFFNKGPLHISIVYLLLISTSLSKLLYYILENYLINLK